MIEVTEPLGNEVIIYFTTGKTPIICRTPILPNKTTNGSYPVFIDMDHVHFFDPESQKSI
jgi:ABC-type sugar transport system ATPase subunit